MAHVYYYSHNIACQDLFFDYRRKVMRVLTATVKKYEMVVTFVFPSLHLDK